jgi:tetratricopeptide (TPR) repeat protein
MKTGRLGVASMLTVAALLLGTAAMLQASRDRRYGTDVPAAQVLYVESPRVAGRLALSFDDVAADVYWIRALQHFGASRKTTAQARNYELLYPLLDMATGLDPHFNIAYRFGAIFLAEPKPGGPGRPDLAIKLLKKALQVSPHKWQYMQDIGFVHFWAMHDYKGAAEWFDKASAVPGAPWFLKPLAATTLAQGGHRSAARTLFRSVAESGENDWMREDAARRLRQLDAMDTLDELRRVVAQYRVRGGSMPMTWETLVRAGYLRGVPVDPDGVAYALGPWTGDVTLGEGSTLAPLPTEPPSARDIPLAAAP